MAEVKVDLLLKAILFPELDDGLAPPNSLYTDLYGVSDSVIDPVGDFLQKSAAERIFLAKGGPADPGWNEEIPTLEKRAAELDFSDIDADTKIYAKRMKEEWGV